MIAKHKINVIDLDNTLIPFDSFRRLLIELVKTLNIRISFLIALRLLRVISQPTFKRVVCGIIKNRKHKRFVNSFANDLCKAIDPSLLATVNSYSDSNTINVLCSASPGIYVEPLAEKLGWVGYGSNYYKGRFINLYGENKVCFIAQKFPKQKFHYNFAVSDSLSDLELIKMFDYHFLKQRKIYK